MGSGNNNRKKNDNPLIRRPKRVFASGSEGPDIGNAAASVCIASFDVRVKKSGLTLPTVPVQLKRQGDVYHIMISGTEIGDLNARLSKMVTMCGKMGFGYSGEIVVINSNSYARFNRVSK
jgi:hypothetical protein